MKLIFSKSWGHCKYFLCSFSLLTIFSTFGFGQLSTGFLRGRVIEGSTLNPLYGVTISINSDSIVSSTSVDGRYLLKLSPGNFTITYKLDGYQRKVVSNIHIDNFEFSQQNIILYPLLQNTSNRYKNILTDDSVKIRDSILITTSLKENGVGKYNILRNNVGSSDVIYEENITAGNDKNTEQLLKRLNGVIVQSKPDNSQLQHLTIMGMGERYNQVMLNGAVVNSFSATEKLYPFSLLPAESIEKVSVQKTGTSSVPADFTGGIVEVTLKDFPDKNFFYLRVGTGFSVNTLGKNFYEDKRSNNEFFGLPGNIRDLPSGFPSSKSATSLNNKTPQEQIDLSMKLKNNLAPINNGKSKPDDILLLGFGRIISLKENRKIGIVAYVNQSKSEIIDKSIVQVMPDVTNNPYPFADNNKTLVSTQSQDNIYSYASQLSGILNASILFGKNKISLTNFIGSTFNNIYTSRTQIYKPDEDTLAHDGVYYKSSHQVFFNTQLSGEHALGENGKFKLNWHAAYNYQSEQNPDERSFLLKQDSADINKFEIGRPSAAPFNPTPFSNPNVYDPNLTNSGRLWRSSHENDFEGAVDIATPFNLLGLSQKISGGIYVKSKYRTFYSDLLPTTGNGYFSLNDLLAPENYSTGNLAVRSYYSSFGGSYSYVYANNRGNYSASANIGASYIRVENKFTKDLFLDWGARVESSTLLVSNTQYDYSSGDSNPTINPLDKNTFVSKVDVLPSIEAKYVFLKVMQFNAGYFKTVNRPQLQELTSYRYYDPVAFLVKIGNPVLQSSSASNFNAGLSWISKAGTSLSVSGFYKKLDQPIENLLSAYTISSLISQPVNMPSAKIYGLTADFKLSLNDGSVAPFLDGLSLFGTGTLITSKVEMGYVRNFENQIQEHTLSGSPNYSFNAGLVFRKFALPSITLLYNGMGDYISAVGYGKTITLNNGKNISAIPDYRVKSRQQIDVQVSQKIFKSKIQIIAGLNNLLNTSYVIYQDLNGNKKFDTALELRLVNGKNGYYQSGTDNTISYIKSQHTYFFAVSYLFN